MRRVLFRTAAGVTPAPIAGDIFNQGKVNPGLAPPYSLAKVATRAMQKLKLALVILAGFMHPAQSSYSEVGPTSSFGIKYQIEQDFSLHSFMTHQSAAQIVFQAVNQANARRPARQARMTDAEIEKLSKDIVGVSSCFGVDPVIFTALVWRESNFRTNSVSETGAVGLTQMTNPGIREVLERTHANGYRKLKHVRRLFERCAPRLFRELPTQISAQTVNQMKSKIVKNPRYAIVFGVVLLKLNLASVQAHGRINRYVKALERYNGDPRIKTLFARDVLTVTKRMIKLPSVASNDSRFLRENPEL
ncbi:MAG: transglycosylase SLT domain-containing protein [Bdellovibrionales bacterium]|nr:transglycosylase SLT domain-containing protein [Bdellovibrionales bacterium]